MKFKLKSKVNKSKTAKIGLIAAVTLFLTAIFYQIIILQQKTKTIKEEHQVSVALLSKTDELLEKTKSELDELKGQDQYQINRELKLRINNIESTYDSAVSAYENLLKLKESSGKTQDLEELFTQALVLLSQENYVTASSVIKELNSKISQEQAKLLAAAQTEIAKNITQSNAPPGAGYSRQNVSSEAGSFLVSIIAADMGSTRVIVDTVSDSDCHNDCPVLPLASYVSRSGAFAGVNGSYFCPVTYPSCAGKTNTYDTLAMNKNKVYFNSDNNIYSNVPAVIFGDGWIRFVSASSQWGRDTGVNGVLANHPLLVSGSNVVFGGDDDPKKGSRGNRSFVANKGSAVYIGVVHSATVAESARVMKALGMENALNLDNGGSTALWYSGYKVGPGRNLPNVILFVRK
jgi:exopolysaccharide biosynthesis protein